MMNPITLAMWSGPRNISTAMMRSWGNRADTVVVDEPLYAYYLTRTEHQHPGADEIVAHYETDWRRVVQQLTAGVPNGKQIYYQKHMTHHILDEVELGWVLSLTNCFLIRNPAEVIASQSKVFEQYPQIDQTGIPQQVRIFEYVCQHTGKIPPVIDASDVLKSPRQTLSALCDALSIPFEEGMLQWGPGSRPTDGIWAKYWYHAVEQSTAFKPYEPQAVELPPSLQPMLDACNALYATMFAHRLAGTSRVQEQDTI